MLQNGLQRTILSQEYGSNVPMPFEYITESLIRELELLEPFGQGNEKPQFALKSLKIRSARVFGP